MRLSTDDFNIMQVRCRHGQRSSSSTFASFGLCRWRPPVTEEADICQSSRSHVNTVQVWQIRRKSRFLFLWRAVNAGIMTRQSHYIFFPFNECNDYVQATFYQSWNECKSSVDEEWPDNALRWTTHTGTIPARSVFHLVTVWIHGIIK